MATIITTTDETMARFTFTADAFVTVETLDDFYVGTISVDGDVVRLDTGLKGRPVLLDADEVVEVLAADESNPYIEILADAQDEPEPVLVEGPQTMDEALAALLAEDALVTV